VRIAHHDAMTSIRRGAAVLAVALLPFVAAVPAAAQHIGTTYKVGDASGNTGPTMSALYADVDGYCQVIAKLRKLPHPGSLAPPQVHQVAPVIDFLRDGLHVRVERGPLPIPCVRGVAMYQVRVLDGRAMFGATDGWINTTNMIGPR
jgi:hypothetical protein